MNHSDLHNDLSDCFKRLKAGTLKPQLAKEIFNGAGKIINLAKTELSARSLGVDMDVPLLEIKRGQVKAKDIKKLRI
jgi:hypothetical protein